MTVIEKITAPLRNFCENIQESPIVKAMGHRWKKVSKSTIKFHHFLTNRAFYSGFAATTGITVAAAYLFQVATPKNGAIFGMANFALLFSTFETLRKYKDPEDHLTALDISIFSGSGIITQAFMKTVLKQQLNTKAASILTLAAIGGQCSRHLFLKD